jgi:hypothetical protein
MATTVDVAGSPPAGEQGAADFPPRRVVLLGASNLTRGISTVVETACGHWGRPLDVLAALGHGRSYGTTSTVLGRTLPGIVECGLWTALAERPRAPTAALLTDVGNDLFYGASPEQIADWVDTCLERLAGHTDQIVLTRMPVCNLKRVRPWHYRVLRNLLFPSCRLSFAEVNERAWQLDGRLAEVAARRHCRLIDPRAEWYGFDPIHIKLAHWPGAWHELLGSGAEQPVCSPARASPRRWFYLRRRLPERFWLFGRPYGRRQPCGRLPDGTMISLY